MPDKYNFDHLPDWGVISVRCIEVGCEAGGPIHSWSERKRENHSKSHHPDVGGIKTRRRRRTREEMEQYRLEKRQKAIEKQKRQKERQEPRLIVCRVCGNEFSIPRRKGRYPSLCPECKEKGWL
jgi:predicted Zn-ribbon and HTH transcriptional regulator